MEENANGENREKSNDIPDYDDGRVVFYYSRERRLERASPAVRALNEAGPPPKRGLFRTLTSSKSMTFTFVSMITLCIIMVLYSLFMTNDGSVKRIHDLEIQIKALSSGDNESFIILKKTIKGANPYAGEAGIVVSPSEEGKTTIHAEKIYFTPEDEEWFRFSLPFSGKTLLVILALDEEKILFKVTPR